MQVVNVKLIHPWRRRRWVLSCDRVVSGYSLVIQVLLSRVPFQWMSRWQSCLPIKFFKTRRKASTKIVGRLPVCESLSQRDVDKKSESVDNQVGKKVWLTGSGQNKCLCSFRRRKRTKDLVFVLFCLPKWSVRQDDSRGWRRTSLEATHGMRNWRRGDQKETDNDARRVSVRREFEVRQSKNDSGSLDSSFSFRWAKSVVCVLEYLVLSWSRSSCESLPWKNERRKRVSPWLSWMPHLLLMLFWCLIEFLCILYRILFRSCLLRSHSTQES